jgi:hypothetical protein
MTKSGKALSARSGTWKAISLTTAHVNTTTLQADSPAPTRFGRDNPDTKNKLQNIRLN